MKVMQQVPPDGNMQLIQAQYFPIPSTTSFQEDTIIRVSGLTVNTTELKLAKLFVGLNIESGGIVMCMTSNGRPSGEALVRFTSKEQRDLALKRNGQKFGSRNVEICKASVQEYSRVLSQDQDRLPQALHNFFHLATADTVIVRMRGLPYNTKASEIVAFFGEESPVFQDQQGILFVYHPDGRPTGDAFVLFENMEHGKQALIKHKQTIGKRYVELFQMTKHEVIQVFTRQALGSASVLPFTTLRSTRTVNAEHLNFMQNNGYSPAMKNIIRLRGLPYSASVQDILDFLEEFAKYVAPAGVHMVYNFQGRPSGDAFIEMRSVDNAQKASETLHKKHIGERYIEVFQCSSSDMTFMLMNGIPSYKQYSTWLNNPYSPRTPPHVATTFSYPPVTSAAMSYHPPVSSPANVPPSNSPIAIISVPTSPTVSPRLYMNSPGYMSYPSPPYTVFSYPSPGMPVDNITHSSPIISPAAFENSGVFFPSHSYQVGNDYAMTHIDPMYLPMNSYMPPSNGYYASADDTPPPPPPLDAGHYPTYVETHSG